MNDTDIFSDSKAVVFLRASMNTLYKSIVDHNKYSKIIMKATIPVIFAIIVCTGCSRSNNDTDDTLNLSDNNKRVLEYYSTHDSLKLKLRAAEFLVANMPDHYSFMGAYMDDYMQKIDSIYFEQPYYNKYVYYSISLNYSHIDKMSQKIFDIDNISADFLILWINKSFIYFQELPWLKDVSFEDFCEHVLPYRLADGLKIEDYYSHSDSIIDSLKSSYAIHNDMESIISTALSIHAGHSNKISYSQIPDPIISNSPIDCHEGALSDYFFFRSLGFPVVYDFVPHWGSRDGRHAWTAFVGHEDMDTHGAAKIYRKAFSKQPKPNEESTGNFIPYFFEDNFIADVTDVYIDTSDCAFRINSQFTNANNIYLCVFNEQQWQPVDWAPNISNKAKFKNVGKGIIYLPITYKGNVEMIIDYPFLLNTNGKIQKLKPHAMNTHQLIVNRKYPLTPQKEKWSANFFNARLEVSNNEKFDNSNTIGTITNMDLPDHMIKLSNITKYKYWRIVSEKKVDIAEIKFIDSHNNIIIPIISCEYDSTNLFDNDKLSYVPGINTITFEFESPLEIKEIIITPRNDGNYIYPRHTYSLFYMDSKGWKLHQTKTATDNYIEFDNVPKNALYWIRNLTEGKEERIFTVDNSENIVFW